MFRGTYLVLYYFAIFVQVLCMVPGFIMPPGTIVPMGAYCFYCVRMYVCMYVCMYVRVRLQFSVKVFG